jgi:hypothetical protein
MIKNVLEIGAATGSDIHRAYREAIRVENGRRARKDKLRPMTYESFRTYITRARSSGLIRSVGHKPLNETPSGYIHPLIAIRGKRVLATQEQTIYELTASGRAAITAWNNLQAYAAGR